MARLSRTKLVTFYIREAGGNYREADSEELIYAVRLALAKKIRKGPVMNSPSLVRDYLITKIGALEHELFGVLLLTNRHALIEDVELFRGTIDGAAVHPREVVKLALAKNAAAVILYHCHPSGETAPSQADEVITFRLREALGLVDIRVIDHFIIAGGDATSFAEKGLL